MHKNESKMTMVTMNAVISLLILAAALFVASLLNIIFPHLYKDGEAVGDIIAMLEGIIGAIATGLVLYQLKLAERAEIHQNDIEEAAFILKYNQAFIQDKNIVEAERLLEDQAYYDRERREIITEENKQKFINYLVYLESLAPLVLRGVLSLDYIDALMAYRFFLAVDNAELQEKEIRPFAEYYRGCFKLYRIWKAYRRARGYRDPVDGCSNKDAMRELDAWEDFEKYAAE